MLQEFKDHWAFLLTCCLEHPKDVDIEDVVEVLYFEPAPQDDDGAAICRLKNGKFLVLTEWQDYTGHG